jgi:imidazolonepropionase-like amidohydrolase
MVRRLVGALLFSALSSLPVVAQAPALSERVRQYVSVDAPVVVLRNVRVVDGTGAAPLEGQTIVIERGRIGAVGPMASVKVPAGAHVIDLAGHTVTPGIVGLHDHTFYTTNQRSVQLGATAPLLYLGSGVTTIRTTGSHSPYNELNLMRAIERRELPGPRMYVAGPYLTGQTSGGSMAQVLTPEAARRIVAYWAEEGATWLKFYTDVSREVMGAAIEEAHRRGLKVTGHLCSVTFREAVGLGIDNLEHGLFVSTDFDPAKQPDLCASGALPKLAGLDVEGDAARAVIREMVARKVPMTSTLPVFESFVANRPPLEQRVLDAMAPEVRTEYLTSRARLADPTAYSISPAVFAKAQRFEYEFAKAGGVLAAGVDATGNGGALPGYGDQRGYELLVEAGFTPVEAIRVMTSNGARVLGNDAIGIIAAGKSADLVVIKGDPIARPAAIRDVVTVFKEGVGYDSAKLIAAVQGRVGIR